MTWLIGFLMTDRQADVAAGAGILLGAWLLLNGTGVLAREAVRDWRARRRTTTALAGLAGAVAAFPPRSSVQEAGPLVSPELLHADAERYAPLGTLHGCGCFVEYLPGGETRLSPCPAHGGNWTAWEAQIRESK
jgi:hypothetical protein